MSVIAVQTETGTELQYTIDDYILAAEAILRTHISLRLTYSVQDVVNILNITQGRLALTVHSLRAAQEMSRWYKDTLGMAIHLVNKCDR